MYLGAFRFMFLCTINESYSYHFFLKFIFKNLNYQEFNKNSRYYLEKMFS